jgi:branched-chain amino acid transport system ATP-binding protein
MQLMPLLDVQEIDVFYGDAQALYGVSLTVNGGEIVTLLGANGAGKSTTLRSVSGLLQPRGGHILFGGDRLDEVPAYELIGRGIAHVPEGRRIFPGMTVLENLNMGAYHPAVWQDRARRLADVVELFPILGERREQLAGTLSGGEQQMLAIGRALMAEPRLLMLDEPSLGLAPRLVGYIFQVIGEIRDQGVTILLVEQNASMALRIADRGYVLETGRVALSGTGEELIDNQHVRQAYLGL